MGIGMISAHAIRHLLSAEQAGGLDDGPLAVHPLGLDRVELRTLDLAAAEDKGVGGAQARGQRLALGVRQWTRKNGRSHARYRTTFSATFVESTLTGGSRAATMVALERTFWGIVAGCATPAPAAQTDRRARRCPAARILTPPPACEWFAFVAGLLPRYP
jgi:hypothetical protein